jgi:hypothetical protein
MSIKVIGCETFIDSIDGTVSTAFRDRNYPSFMPTEQRKAVASLWEAGCRQVGHLLFQAVDACIKQYGGTLEMMGHPAIKDGTAYRCVDRWELNPDLGLAMLYAFHPSLQLELKNDKGELIASLAFSKSHNPGDFIVTVNAQCNITPIAFSDKYGGIHRTEWRTVVRYGVSEMTKGIAEDIVMKHNEVVTRRQREVTNNLKEVAGKIVGGGK